ncbi:MAG: hypothetical protein ACLQGP_04400 [Isosphaeraceae bacterium]
MAGPNHNFFLLSQTEHPFTGYMRFINDPRAIQLHDDLVGYMYDSLVWIPSFNPAKGEPSDGLCRWGPTIIHTDGASRAAKIFSSWADIFSTGPELLHLTGEWSWTEVQPQSSGEYERLEFDRQEIVGALRRLAAHGERVAAGDGDLYILHLGI